jgi:virginiamycin B lyase
MARRTVPLTLIALSLLVFTPIAEAQRQRDFPLPTFGKPRSITVGPDRALWFTSDFEGNLVGRITTSGQVREFPLPNPNSQPDSITTGPDGNLWFTERGGDRIGRLTPAGALKEFPLAAGSRPRGIVRGFDGAMWFTQFGRSRIGRIDMAGAVTEFSAGITAGAQPLNIARGSDGNLWFTEPTTDRIGRITRSGVVTEFGGLSNLGGPEGIAAGPDGSLWFTEEDGDRVGRITTSGRAREFVSGITPGANPFGIAPGPDGNMWFTQFDRGAVARITRAGKVQELPLRGATRPMGIVTGPDHRLWIAQFGRNVITRFDPPAPPRVKAATPYTFSFDGPQTRFTSLRVTGAPRNGRIEVRCTGRGCSFKRLRFKKRRTVKLTARVRRPLRTGARLELRVTEPGLSGFVRRLTVRFGRAPREQTLCLPPGAKSPRKRCG